MQPHTCLELLYFYSGQRRPSRLDSKLLLAWAPLVPSLTMGAGYLKVPGFTDFVKHAGHLASVTARCRSFHESAMVDEALSRHTAITKLKCKVSNSCGGACASHASACAA